MIRVAFVRGKYLNSSEGQNFIFTKKDGIILTGISSKKPLHEDLPFPTIKLPSLSDIFEGRVPRIIANRTLGDIQNLESLEDLAGDFDIFHTADPHYYYSYQLARMRKQGRVKALVSTWCETIPFNNESTYAKKKLKSFTMNYVDHYITLSERAKDALMKEGVGGKKITIIPMGVDLKRFKEKRENRGNKKLTILFVGRLVPEKGVLDLVEAFLNIERNNVELKIVGEGPLKEEVEKRLEHKIASTGYSTINTQYQEADIIVIPSKTISTWEEQYGMVAVEAMASGLPIIAYKSGSLPLVLAEAALWVKEGNIAGLAEALRSLVDNSQLRFKLGTIARRRAEARYDSISVKDRYKKLYEDFSGRSYQK